MSLVTRCVGSIHIFRWKFSEALVKSAATCHIQPLYDIHHYNYHPPSLRHFHASTVQCTSEPRVKSASAGCFEPLYNIHRHNDQYPLPRHFHASAVRYFARTPETGKKETNETTTKEESADVDAAKPPTLFQKFKQMSKDYWYVLIPVHVITSVGWFGAFYFAVKSGLDVVALLESLGVSEKIINPLKGSSAGYVALAYAMYKVATPARYTVTLGGTTASIKYLTSKGYIKPVPSKEKLQLMYDVRKQKFNKQRDAFRRKLRQHRAELKKKSAISKTS